MLRTGYEELRSLFARFKSRPMPEERPIVALGPCAVESERMIEAAAEAAATVGAAYLRGGAFKLRTSPDSFQGLGITGWRFLHAAASRYGLKTVSEVTTTDQLTHTADLLDMLQIGARSMWNHDLLRAAAESGKPILLKRGIGATTSEWLWAAIRLQDYGATSLVLCERGNPTFDAVPRNALDLSTLVFLLTECPLPVWLDVSHTAGESTVALQLIAAGARLGVQGLLVELHPDPRLARCDREQAIAVADLNSLRSALKGDWMMPAARGRVIS
jgi:3-deoxy-7-phosphoheptulonate synthase